ncbi:N-methyl-L-tryptophan oxidase [Undibacterium sp.]|uniref:N-methyl-L-tryptophan oxidase n=1 Tax=Undibacterium sp. TaxID=1914977 RepID=UPI002C56A5A5|nr:N-methyl-L-tryptophan oxidase [Undibacterium sp.]HTD03294.1 N-methyl-L-tryptophan oxidase [Undibacterium sp.]
MKDYDVVVVGLGVMGSSTIFHLARSGASVLGIESFGPTHQFGSSHGETRIFRRAYWEGEKYLPLLNRAHELWTELQATSNEKLIVPTGGIFMGHPSTGIVKGSRNTAEAGAIAYEVLDTAQIRRRFPAFRVPDDMEAIYEPGAYIIMANKVRLQMIDLAIQSGAETRFGRTVQKIEKCGESILLTMTNNDEKFRARSVVITTGPWMAHDLLPELSNHLSSNRVPIYWFDSLDKRRKEFTSDNFPAFLYDHPDGHLIYGIPAGVSSERGVKIGFHNRQHVPCKPDGLKQSVSTQHIGEISRYIKQLLPGLNPNPIASSSCFYTMSTDENFLIGASEKYSNVFFASACSGHGFKFGSAIGESLALLAQGKKPPTDLSVFAVSRFSF